MLLLIKIVFQEIYIIDNLNLIDNKILETHKKLTFDFAKLI